MLCKVEKRTFSIVLIIMFTTAIHNLIISSGVSSLSCFIWYIVICNCLIWYAIALFGMQLSYLVCRPHTFVRVSRNLRTPKERYVLLLILFPFA